MLYNTAQGGGKGAHRTCICAKQNSGTQVLIFSAFVRTSGCHIREPEVSRDVTKSSSEKSKVVKRRRLPTADTFGTSVSEFISVSNTSYVYVPIKDLMNGHYGFQLLLTGQAKSVQVMDENGETYYNEPSGPNQLVKFDVTDIKPEYAFPGP